MQGGHYKKVTGTTNHRTLVTAFHAIGARRSARAIENAKRVARFAAPLRELQFDRLASEAYGAMRAELAKSGRQFGPVDMLIAATALANGLTVVTNNTREFERAKGLRVENWVSSRPGRRPAHR